MCHFLLLVVYGSNSSASRPCHRNFQKYSTKTLSIRYETLLSKNKPWLWLILGGSYMIVKEKEGYEMDPDGQCFLTP